MRNFSKSIIVGVMALCFLALAGEANAAFYCYPATPQSLNSYPIKIVNPNGTAWRGSISPGLFDATVYNANGSILGTYPISNLSSTSSCFPTGTAKFILSSVGDGNTWVTIVVKSGFDNWENTVLWFGNSFTRTKFN